MEKELNIAAILKDKPENTKLWSPIVGNCTFSDISSKNGAIVASFIDKDGEQLDWDFNEYGKTLSAPKEAEVCLFPSNGMRSWEKFAWKKGDVLILDGEEGIVYCIFEAFEDDEYTLFKSRFACSDESRNIWLPFNTKSFTKHYKMASDDEANEFIKKVEEHYGGKLNLETLDIEQPKPEFKDGDILVAEKDAYYDKVIFIASIKSDISSKALILAEDEDYEVDFADYRYGHNRTLRLATDSEKQQLFDALAKEGKAWDEEKKAIVDIPKKCEFEQMDLCLMSDGYDESLWNLCQFAFKDGDGFYHSIGGGIWRECIPYNDSTKHLLGTTDEWKGGEDNG